MTERVHPVALVREASAEDYDFGRDHPLAPVRVTLTHALIEDTGLATAPGVVHVTPEVEPERDLRDTLRVHDADYVATVHDLSRAIEPGTRFLDASDDLRARAATVGLGAGDTPAFAGVHDASLAVVRASAAAARRVLSGEVLHAFNPGGGLHHAMPDRAAGFCVYNDVAVAIATLLDDGAERVAYVDVDVHHGDGVERMFADDPRVLTISLHESGSTLFPGTGDATDVGVGAGRASVVNVPFAPQTSGAVWLDAFDAVVEPLVRAFQPDVLVTQLGCDTHATDPLAHLALTLDDMAAIAKRLHALAHEAAEGRWVATGGGGYQLVSVVPRAWTLAFAEMTGAPLPTETPMTWRELVVARTGQAPPRDFDDAVPLIDDDVKAHARRMAAESVATVRGLVFPRHGVR
ncbi:MAG: acetoin utilization protein AcuC [Actinomycetota bacterium]|nr:acetoin utilization protein AcuC [Actinomycetota bacterium]